MNNESATVEGCWLSVEWKASQGDAGFRQAGLALRIEGLGKSGIGGELIPVQPRAAGEA